MKAFARWGVVTVVFSAFLTVPPFPDIFAHENSRASIVVGESTDEGIGAGDEKGWAALFHRFLEFSFFQSPADFHSYAVTGATAQEILENQLPDALSDIATHEQVVVSLGGGGNDLLNFVSSPEFQQVCAVVGIECLTRFNLLLTEVEIVLNQLVRRIRVAGRNTPIVVRVEFNPFLKDSCGGPTDPLAQLANLVLEGSDDVPLLRRGLNDRIRAVAARHNAKVIEIFEILAANPNALIAEDCLHPNEAGHAAIYAAAVAAFRQEQNPDLN